MSKELDTSWFDLKNYEPFKTMSIEGWIWQLEARQFNYFDCERLNSKERWNKQTLLSNSNKIKEWSYS